MLQTTAASVCLGDSCPEYDSRRLGLAGCRAWLMCSPRISPTEARMLFARRRPVTRSRLNRVSDTHARWRQRAG
ncbi:hypothetical protein CGRA01v4_01006 [Colletotrichum graminicola]|nr:hypothetical protein CGRA01v4_01006 [Colletotrichum graminicola]